MAAPMAPMAVHNKLAEVGTVPKYHDDGMTWKCFPHYWSLVNSSPPRQNGRHFGRQQFQLHFLE